MNEKRKEKMLEMPAYEEEEKGFEDDPTGREDAEIICLVLRHDLKKLGRERFLNMDEALDEEQYRLLKNLTQAERLFMIGLLEQYPEASNEELGKKFMRVSEFGPWMFA